MTDKVKLHATMDAKVWAEEFWKLWGNRLNEFTEEDIFTWFANTIMCGFDHANQRRDAKDSQNKTLPRLTDGLVGISKEIRDLRREPRLTQWGEGSIGGLKRAWHEITGDWEITEAQIISFCESKEQEAKELQQEAAKTQVDR